MNAFEVWVANVATADIVNAGTAATKETRGMRAMRATRGMRATKVEAGGEAADLQSESAPSAGTILCWSTLIASTIRCIQHSSV